MAGASLDQSDLSRGPQKTVVNEGSLGCKANPAAKREKNLLSGFFQDRASARGHSFAIW